MSVRTTTYHLPSGKEKTIIAEPTKAVREACKILQDALKAQYGSDFYMLVLGAGHRIFSSNEQKAPREKKNEYGT